MPEPTLYRLTIDTQTPSLQQVASKLTELADHLGPQDPGYSQTTDLWTDVLENLEPASWTSHEHDLAKVSTQWPDTLFSLEIHGEPLQNALLYCHNGLVQLVEPQFPPFDPASTRHPRY